MRRLEVTIARFWCGSVLALIVLGGDVLAQPSRPSFGFSAGAAIPGGALGARRTAAPYVAVSALFRSAEHVARFRLDLDAARFWGRTVPGFSGPIEHGDLTVASLLGHLILGQRGRAGLYTMFGIGMHWMSIPGRSNPDGNVWGVGVGLGAKIPVRRVTLEAEMRAHAILSDYGNSEFEASYFYPLTVAVRF
jgi:hypothetical protein